MEKVSKRNRREEKEATDLFCVHRSVLQSFSVGMKERVCECPKGARYHDSRLCGCGDRVSLRNTRVSPLIPSTKEKVCGIDMGYSI